MYYLMNKNEYVASIIQQGNDYEPTFDILEAYGIFPIGFRNIDCWIKQRTIINKRRHIKRIIRRYMQNSIKGIIAMTHCISINDTYWIKSDSEDLVWEDVSPYTNQLSELLSEFAISSGINPDSAKMSIISPEVTTGGSFPKCCINNNGKLQIVKRGLDDTGLECYCEYLAQDIYKRFVNNLVRYDLKDYNGKLSSICDVFTNEDIGFVSYVTAYGDDKFESIIATYDRIGNFDDFAGMIVADALCVNDDRHLNNHGFLVDNKEQYILSMSPVFDENLAFVPSAEKDDFEEMLEYANSNSSGYFDKLLWKARTVLTDSLRNKLKDMLYYELSFEGNDVFTKDRVAVVNAIVRGHARRLLSM